MADAPFDNPLDLARFVAAQDGGVFDRALAEIVVGKKRSHWMWFIFPQHRDLGRSDVALTYGLAGLDEARAFLAHPLLSRRLHAVAAAMLDQLRAGLTASEVLGPVDALKLGASMAIFAEADPADPLFAAVVAALESSGGTMMPAARLN